MDNLLHEDLNPTPEDEDDTHSYMDEDDVHEVQRHHWLSETALGVQLMQDSAHTRADSPLLGNDHFFALAQEPGLNKTLPDMSRPLSHLRSSSTASVASSASNGTPTVAATASGHRRTSHSQLSTPSRRPSLARKPSLPLLSESAQVPQTPVPSVRQSARLHSIASSLSLGCNRNAVYIDSEEVSTRLDDWLSSGNPELDQDDDDEDFDAEDYYVTSFGRPQDSPPTTSVTPTYLQGPPPNTPMTVYCKPSYASSQIYVGQGATADSHIDDDARSEESCIHIPSTSPRRQQTQDTITSTIVISQMDASATPVLHEKPLSPEHSFSSSSSESPGGSPMFSATTLSTSRTSPSSIPSQSGPPPMLSSKPSLASLSMGVLSPKPSLTSIGFGYQNHISSPTDSNLLSPPPVTASRWSLTSSVAGDVEKDNKKKKEKVQKSPGGTRRRLASIISKLAGNSPSKEARQSSESVTLDQEKQVNTRERSFTDGSTRSSTLLPPAPIKSRSKPPSLKLSTLVNSQSVSNLRSPTLSSKPSLTSLGTPLSPTRSMFNSSTPMPTPTFASPITTSPISATFIPTSPITGSFASTRLSVSTSMTTTSTNTASPLMPTTPILSDVPLATPTLKSAVSVPALSANWERPGLIRRDSSFGWSTNSSYYNESSPTSPTKDYEDEDDIEDDAAYYVREFSLSRKETFEEERQARLSLITDMLDRDLKASSPQQDGDAKRDNVIPGKRKGSVKIDETEAASFISRTSPTHFRKSSSASRASMPSRRSVSGPSLAVPLSPSIPPPLPSKNGFRNLAARMGISNSVSTPQPLPRAAKDTDAKRKSIASFVSNGKRKNPKRRLVISGVGDGQCEIDALKDWCASLGEVRSMVKVKGTEGEVTQIGQSESSGRNVWVVDFKKSSVAETASHMAKVEIKGAGNVRLSWETAKPKISFGMGKKGWIP